VTLVGSPPKRWMYLKAKGERVSTCLR